MYKIYFMTLLAFLTILTRSIKPPVCLNKTIENQKNSSIYNDTGIKNIF